jgi:hypothetical protein
VVKKVKAKGPTKKKTAAKKKGSARKATRPATRAKAAAKYEQPGAPWWKRVPARPPKV